MCDLIYLKLITLDKFKDDHPIVALVYSKLIKYGDGSYKCSDCKYAFKVTACVKIHIESKHIDTGGFTYQDCGKHVPNSECLESS